MTVRYCNLLKSADTTDVFQFLPALPILSQTSAPLLFCPSFSVLFFSTGLVYFESLSQFSRFNQVWTSLATSATVQYYTWYTYIHSQFSEPVLYGFSVPPIAPALQDDLTRLLCANPRAQLVHGREILFLEATHQLVLSHKWLLVTKIYLQLWVKSIHYFFTPRASRSSSESPVFTSHPRGIISIPTPAAMPTMPSPSADRTAVHHRFLP